LTNSEPSEKVSEARASLSGEAECNLSGKEHSRVQEETLLEMSTGGADEMSFAMDASIIPERLVKSSERVRDLGEVFTPSATVREMLDLLPKKIWAVHPSPTFLEPACGDGNFLTAILSRKLERITQDLKNEKLPAGSTVEAAQFHALEALASIYAVDISVDNVVGGTVGHEIGARTRLVTQFSEWNKWELGKTLNERSLALKAARWITEHNIIVGNMLATDSLGKPTGRDDIPLIVYSWDPENQSVNLSKTTMGEVIATEEEKSGAMLSLFAAEEPLQIWRGNALSINEAERVLAPLLRGPAINGTGRRVR
jgi:hypothetical protein